MTITSGPTITGDDDQIIAFGAELLAAVQTDAPKGLELARAELRDVFWACGLDVKDLRVARAGLALLRYVSDRAAKSGGGHHDTAVADALVAVATAFAGFALQPIPAQRIISGTIIQLPGEDSWWEVIWRRPGSFDGQVTARALQARPGRAGWTILDTTEYEPRLISVAADSMVLRS